MSYQQNLKSRKLALVVLGSNIWPIVINHGAEITSKADAATQAFEHRWGDQQRNQGRVMKTKVGNRKTLTGARTKFGVELEESGKDILAHLRGEAKLSTRRIVLPGDVDVRQVRMQTGMSQGEFARAFCINPRTLQEWEQGRRKPDATSRAYLAVIQKNRGPVLDALASKGAAVRPFNVIHAQKP